MAQDPSEIKNDLRRLLAEADRKKNRQSIGLAIFACILGLTTIGLVYDLLTDWLDFGGFMAGLLGAAAGLVSLTLVAGLDDLFTGKRTRRLAKQFHDSFPPGSADYGIALTLLKTAKSESEVEDDLIKGLDEGIQLGATTKPVNTSKGEAKVGSGLLGEFDDLKPAKSSNKDARPGHIPLDPYDAPHDTDQSSDAA